MTMLKQIFQTPDGSTFDSKADAERHMRRPAIMAALLGVAGGQEKLAETLYNQEEAIRDALVRQLHLPVRWTGCMQALAAAGITRIGECGPGKVLCGLARRIDKALDARPLGTPSEHQDARAAWA